MCWIQTYTNRKFYPFDPSADDVCIEDVAHALALMCRYGGQCREFFSVAQHSVAVSRMVPSCDALWGLLHDAAEAYLSDVCRPIKPHLYVGWQNGFLSFARIEERLLSAVAERFGLSMPMPSAVRSADLCQLERERRQLMGEPPEEWSTSEWWDGDVESILSWKWSLAEERFLERFVEIKEKGDR